MGLSTVVGEAFVKFKADLSDFAKGLGTAKKQTGAAAESMSSMLSKGLGSLAKIALPAGITAGIIALGKAAMDTAGQLHDMSLKTGVSVETLSTLGYAASQSGSSVEAVGAAFGKLAQTQMAAIGGSTQLKEAYHDVGLEIEDLRAMSPEEVFGATAKGLMAIENPAKRSATAVKLLGKSGADLIPTMKEVAETGFAGLTEKAKSLHVLLDADVAASIEALGDNFGDLNQAMKGSGMLLMREISPALSIFIEKITGVGASAGETYNPLKLLGEVLKGVLSVVLILVDGIEALIRANVVFYGGIGKGIGQLVKGDFAGAKESVKGAFTGMVGEFKTGGDKIITELERLYEQVENRNAAGATNTRDLLTELGDEQIALLEKQAEIAAAVAMARAEMALQKAVIEGDAEAVAQLTAALDKLKIAQMMQGGMTKGQASGLIEMGHDVEDAKAKADAEKALDEAMAKLAADRKTAADAARAEELEAIDAWNEEILIKAIESNDAIRQAQKSMLEKTLEDYKANATTIDQIYSATVYNVEGLLTDVLMSGVEGGLDSIEDSFKNFFKNLMRQIVNFMIQQAVIKFMTSFMGGGNTLGTNTSASGAVLGSLMGLSPGVSPAAGGAVWPSGFSAFAGGGIVNKPTLGLIGEGRYNEAIIPMPNGAVPVQMQGSRDVAIDQRIVIAPEMLSAMKTSPSEIITVVSGDIMRNGEIRRAIKARST